MRKAKVILLLIIIISISLLFLMDFSTMMILFDVNEHMYITAGALIKQHKHLYQDFAFLQMPNLPLLYGYIYYLTNLSYYLLIGKLISFIFFSLSALMIFLISKQLSQNLFLSLTIFMLYLSNLTILRAASEASNYIMPITFSFLGFYLYLYSLNKNKINFMGMCGVGFFIALAIGFKLYYIIIIIPFMITSLIYPRSITLKIRLQITVTALMLGLLTGLIPTFYYIQQAPRAFIFYNFGFHTTVTQWRYITGFELGMSLHSKLIFLVYVITLEIFPLLLTISTIIPFFFRKIAPYHNVLNRIPLEIFLSSWLFILAIPTILTPTPIFWQYFAMPISFLFLFIITLYSRLSAIQQSRLSQLIILFTFLTILYPYFLPHLNSPYHGPYPLNSLQYLSQPNKWAGIRIHEESLNIRNQLPQSGLNPQLATLSPLYAIEANIPIYDELATGVFLYQIGDLLTTEQRRNLHGTSPQTIFTLFNQLQPVGILVNCPELDPELDKRLKEYAIQNNYQKIAANWCNTGELYIINNSSTR